MIFEILGARSLKKERGPLRGIRMKFKWFFFFLILLLILPPFSASQTKDPGKLYKVAILPFVINSQENLDYLREGIYDILASRITVEGRIEVIDRSMVERALYEERPTRLDEGTAIKIGTRAGADYVVLGSLTKVGDYISLDARLLNITEDKPPLSAFTQHKGLDDVMVKIGEFAQEIGAKILGRRVTAGGVREGRSTSFIQRDMYNRDFKKSQTFNFEIRGLDIGDVDGDKKNEVVVIDNSNIYVFKYDGDKLTLFRKIDAGYVQNFLTLDVADVNRNGVAEIIVTSVVDDNLRSIILEFEEGRFKKITDQAGWFLRVLEHPKEGPVLIGQKMGPDGLFTGPIYRMDWKKTSFESGQKMPFPKETRVFGLALGYVRNPKDLDLVVLDELDNLSLIGPDGKRVWIAREKFGGTTTFYDTRKKRDIQYKSGEMPGVRTYIPARILTKDFDGNGLHEVIIHKNYSNIGVFERIKTFEKGEIYDLVWDENKLATNWKTRETPGYISDYQIKDADNDGEEDMVVAVVTPGAILDRKDTSNIYFYKFF
jgi:TolB-like protein